MFWTTTARQVSSRWMTCRTMVVGYRSLPVGQKTMGTWMVSSPTSSPLNPIAATRTTTLQNTRWSSSLSSTEIQKRLDEFQHLFVEARLCIEDVNESEGTKYFDEDAEAAKEAVEEAIQAFEQLIQDIEDPQEKNRVLRGNGLKVEQLKGELDLALKGGHDH